MKGYLLLSFAVALWLVLLVYCDYQNRYHNRVIRPTVWTHIKGYLR